MLTLIYNCSRCKFGRRVEYPFFAFGGAYRIDGNGNQQPPAVWIQAMGGGRPTVYGGDVEKGICPHCKKMMKSARLKATVNPGHACDARCINARGADCECSCGGANHGQAWT